MAHAEDHESPRGLAVPSRSVPLREVHGAAVLDEKQCQEFADFIKETLTERPDGCFVALAPKIEYLTPLRNKLLAARIGFGEPNEEGLDVRVMLATPETIRLIAVPIVGLVFHQSHYILKDNESIAEPYVLR